MKRRCLVIRGKPSEFNEQERADVEEKAWAYFKSRRKRFWLALALSVVVFILIGQQSFLTAPEGEGWLMLLAMLPFAIVLFVFPLQEANYKRRVEAALREKRDAELDHALRGGI